MSSRGYATPLRLEVGANPQLQGLYLGIVLCAVIALLFLPLPLIIKLLAFAILLYLVRRGWRTRAELGGRSVKLVWDGENQWWWLDDEEYAAELLGDSYLSPRLAVLNFRITGLRQTRAVVLTPSAIDEETFRQMMVRFQITPKEGAPG